MLGQAGLSISWLGAAIKKFCRKEHKEQEAAQIVRIFECRASPNHYSASFKIVNL